MSQQITKIAQQKKKKDRYSIFLDDQYAFSVEEDVLVRFQLTKGLTLSEEQIAEITDSDQFQRAYLLAIHYLSYRMRSTKEICMYLQKKDIDAIWIDQIVQRLDNEKLIDDTAFSNAFVRDRMHHSSKGPRIIRKELMEKGVRPQIAEQAVSLYEKEAQKQTVTNWLKKERRKTTRHSARKREEQLRMKLYQNGFDQDVVADVFQNHPPEIDVKQEQSIFQKQADRLYAKHRKKYSGYELKMKLKGQLYQRGFSSGLIDEYLADLSDEQE